LKLDRYRFVIGLLCLFVGSIYFINGAINEITSKDALTIITTRIKSISEQSSTRRQIETRYYTIEARGYDNEFFIAPDYNNILLVNSIQNEINKNPNQIFEIGIRKSNQSKLNNNKRIDVYSIETDSDYYLNIHRVIDVNKGNKRVGLIVGSSMLLFIVFCFMKF